LTGDAISRDFEEATMIVSRTPLGSGVTNNRLDQICDAAIAGGARGGKLLGAGGGFMVFVVRPDQKAAVREALRGLVQVSARPAMHEPALGHGSGLPDRLDWLLLDEIRYRACGCCNDGMRETVSTVS
jgi:hypothetical protein